MFVPIMSGSPSNHSVSHGRAAGIMPPLLLERGDEGLEWFFDEIMGCIIHGSGCNECQTFRQHMMNAQMQRSSSYTYAHRERMKIHNSADSVLLERHENLAFELATCKSELTNANEVIADLHQRLAELEQEVMPRKRSRRDDHQDGSTMLSTRSAGTELCSNSNSVDPGVTTGVDSTSAIQFGSRLSCVS